MALCDDTLFCNFPKCRAKLTGFAWVTACSHAFCDQHGSGEFSRSPAICPACSSALSGKLDIVRTELSPSEDYKAMVLAGLRPETVLDICARALAFWNYQGHQERLFQEYSLSRVEGQLKQMEKVLSQQAQTRELELNAMRGEISSLKRVMEEYKRKYSEVSERLMERNRQYQKLQGLYDSLRLRNMVVGEREGGGGAGGGAGSSMMMRSYPAELPPGLQHRPVTPQPSPQVLRMAAAGEGDPIFFSLEPEGPRNFFQFSSPPAPKDRRSIMPKK